MKVQQTEELQLNQNQVLESSPSDEIIKKKQDQGSLTSGRPKREIRKPKNIESCYAKELEKKNRAAKSKQSRKSASTKSNGSK